MEGDDEMAKMPWLKLHTEIVDDQKLMDLTAEDFRLWIFILCLARANESAPGKIEGGARTISWRCRIALQVVTTSLETFRKLRMISTDGNDVTVCNFEKRQYDYPSDRPEATRERKRRSRASHDTDTDREEETDVQPDEKSRSRFSDAVPARATPEPKTTRAAVLESEPPEGRFEPDYDQPVDNSWVLRGGAPQKEPPSNAPGWRRVVGASYERCFGLALAGRPLLDFGAFIDRGVPAIRIAEAIEAVFSAKPRPRVPLAAIKLLLENTPANEPIHWKTRAEIEAENEKPVTVDKPRLVWTP